MPRRIFYGKPDGGILPPPPGGCTAVKTQAQCARVARSSPLGIQHPAFQPTGDFTVAVRFFDLNAGNVNFSLFSLSRNSPGAANSALPPQMRLRSNGAGKYGFHFSNGVSSGPSPRLGTDWAGDWETVIVTRTGNVWRAYQNGTLIVTYTFAGIDLSDPATIFLLNGFYGVDCGFGLLFDWAAFYGRALDATEISIIHSLSIGSSADTDLPATGLVGHWKFNDNAAVAYSQEGYAMQYWDQAGMTFFSPSIGDSQYAPDFCTQSVNVYKEFVPLGSMTNGVPQAYTLSVPSNGCTVLRIASIYAPTANRVSISDINPTLIRYRLLSEDDSAYRTTILDEDLGSSATLPINFIIPAGDRLVVEITPNGATVQAAIDRAALGVIF